MTEEQLPDESSNGEVLSEQDLGSKSDVSTELVPLISSELESPDETLHRTKAIEGGDESATRRDRNEGGGEEGSTHEMESLHLPNILLSLLISLGSLGESIRSLSETQTDAVREDEGKRTDRVSLRATSRSEGKPRIIETHSLLFCWILFFNPLMSPSMAC